MKGNVLPTLFISHGGGPWPYVEGELRELHSKLEASLADIPRQIGERPKGILMISGHWEESHFTVMSAPHPPMIYDYSGFPEHTYRIHYSAPGSPALAQRVSQLIQGAGFPVTSDPDRGFDHGAFVPLAVMYPDADVPVVQLSLRSDYDPGAHIAVGRALAPLRQEGVLIIGSGLSYHNLRRFGNLGAKASHEFDDWLNNALNLDSRERLQSLHNWTQAPSARDAHPREDHFMPLMVAFGAAENEKAEVIYHQDDFFGALAVSSFRFGS